MQFQVIVKRDTVRPAELRFVNIHKYTCLKALIQTHHPGSASQTTQYAVSSEEHGSPHLRYAASCSRYLLVGRKETHFCSSKNQVADKQQTPAGTPVSGSVLFAAFPHCVWQDNRLGEAPMHTF